MSLEKKLKISIAVTVMLCVALCMTSFAMAILASSYVKGHSFATGTIDVEVTGKDTIDVVPAFAPGMTLEKRYVVDNKSPVDIWYRVFFENVGGKLQETVELTVKEDGSGVILYDGLAKDFVESSKAITVGDSIPASGSRELVLTFTFPELAGNEYQGAELTFDLVVRAVQKKNNPDKQFQ